MDEELALTPSATQDVGEPTPGQPLGPYFKPGSPERRSLLEPGSAGRPLSVSGRVLNVEGRPIAGALLDFWHADEDGKYDLEGYRYRGYQFTGEDGLYGLETIFPGIYAWRARHIHVRVDASGGSGPAEGALVTQQYFPNEPRNETDPIFDARLLFRSFTSGDGMTKAAFDFVLSR